MTKQNLPTRVMLWCIALACLLVLAGLAGGGPKAALGMAVGAALGLFSFWSLSYAIPRFVSPERPDRRLILGLIYLFKILLFGLVLLWAMSSSLLQPFGVFIGALIAPMVIITLRLNHALAISTESLRSRFRSLRRASRTPFRRGS